MATNPPFGVVIPSRPVLVNPVVISTTQVAFTIPSKPTFSHITVFFLPGTVIPEDTLASIHVQLPGSDNFKLLGAIGNEKQSAIFKINSSDQSTVAGNAIDELGPKSNAAEDSMPDVDAAFSTPEMSSSDTVADTITLGIAIEPSATIMGQLAALRGPQSGPSTGLMLNRNQPKASPVSTKVLAQRIIKNAFNFLASFAGSVGAGGEEVIPMKGFLEWWTKFERRIENDPSFLERDNDD